MHFIKYPVPLWFLPAGSGTDIQKSAALDLRISTSAQTSLAFSSEFGSIIAFNFSAAYNISVSAQDVTSVQIEMSAFSYKVSTSAVYSLTAFLSAGAVGPLEGLTAPISITPIFTLQQSGQTSHSVSANYKISVAGASGSIAAYLTATGSYSLSIAPNISASASNQFSASAAYAISLSSNFLLNVTQEAVFKSIADQYPISLSATIRIVVDTGGGLVWGRRKKRYFPHKIGFPLRD